MALARAPGTKKRLARFFSRRLPQETFVSAGPGSQLRPRADAGRPPTARASGVPGCVRCRSQAGLEAGRSQREAHDRFVGMAHPWSCSLGNMV